MAQLDDSTEFRGDEESTRGSSTTAGTRLSKPDLIKKMQGLLKKHEGNRKYLALIANELNAEGILSPHGKKWQTYSVSDFLKKNIKEQLKPSPKGEPTSKKPVRGKKTKAEKMVKATPSAEPKKTLLLDDHLPRFRKDIKRAQVSYRISTELVKRAEEKRSGDVPRSGGTIRELIELLLWHYVDRPEEFLWMHQGEKW